MIKIVFFKNWCLVFCVRCVFKSVITFFFKKCLTYILIQLHDNIQKNTKIGPQNISQWLICNGSFYNSRVLFCPKFNFKQLLCKAFLMRYVFLVASSPKPNLLSRFEYWYLFVRRPTHKRLPCFAFLPSWLDTLVSMYEAMIILSVFSSYFLKLPLRATLYVGPLARDCRVAFLPSWLDTLVSMYEAMIILSIFSS